MLAEDGALPAIVYAGTRAECDQLSARLAEELGLEVLAYHAGMPREARAEAQRRFMAGEAPVVVATNAFGMGVDKADVRTVCHESVPGSLEAYYQEAGRARPRRAPGPLPAVRLGARTRGCTSSSSSARRSRSRRSRPWRARCSPPPSAAAGASTCRSGRWRPRRAATTRSCARSSAISPASGVVQPAPAPPDRVLGRVTGAWDGRALALCRSAAQEGTRARWRQYRAVWAWVEERRCRREGILRHFGDTSAPAPDGPCCDVCDPGLLPAPPPVRRAGGVSRQLAHRPAVAGDVAALDEAIVEVVALARPSLGRTRAVEVLRGGRSKVLLKHGWDGLPHYGTFGHLSGATVLERVDALLRRGHHHLVRWALPGARGGLSDAPAVRPRDRHPPPAAA